MEISYFWAACSASHWDHCHSYQASWLMWRQTCCHRQLLVCPAGADHSCSFSYSWAVTPRVDSVDPPLLDGTATTLLRISGSFVVNQLVRALLLPRQAAPEAVAAAAAAAVIRSSGNASSSVPECAVQSANNSAVECLLPSHLLPGSWQVWGL
jgi:hypothetical protein